MINIMNYNIKDFYVKNIIDENAKRVIDFFQFSPQITITITVLNYEEFKKEYESYLGNPITKEVTGFVEDDTNSIFILNFDDYQYTVHQNDSKEDFAKVIIHEFVHVIHDNYCNKNYPSKDLSEGIACYLANQTENPYYEIMAKIIASNSHENLLKMLKNLN